MYLHISAIIMGALNRVTVWIRKRIQNDTTFKCYVLFISFPRVILQFTYITYNMKDNTVFL